MSPHHLEADSAIQELMAERPNDAQRSRSLEAVMRPRRTSLRIQGAAAAVTVVVASTLLLVPTRGNGFSWAEVVRRTQLATNMHSVDLDANGNVVGERWRSGVMWASWNKDESGRIQVENRCDRSHFYSYLYRRDFTAPNASQYATLWNRTPQMIARSERFAKPVATVDELLNSGKAKLLNHGRVDSGGQQVERYELTMYGNRETVDADPTTGRMLYLRSAGRSVKMDYPESIDPAVFSYKSRLTRDVPVLDLRGKEDLKKLPPYMPATIASQNGIQLRGVSLSPEGDLFVYWTGFPPDKRALPRIRVIGTRTGVVRWFGYNVDGIHPVQGPPAKRLVCYRVELPEKIGARLTIRIPTAHSYAEFRNVPVERMQPLKE